MKPTRQQLEDPDYCPSDTTVRTESEGESDYEVRQILAERIIRGETRYLIEWLNYPIWRSTWEPERSIASKETLEAWRRKKEQIALGFAKEYDWKKLEREAPEKKERRKEKRYEKRIKLGLPLKSLENYNPRTPRTRAKRAFEPSTQTSPTSCRGEGLMRKVAKTSRQNATPSKAAKSKSQASKRISPSDSGDDLPIISRPSRAAQSKSRPSKKIVISDSDDDDIQLVLTPPRLAQSKSKPKKKKKATSDSDDDDALIISKPTGIRRRDIAGAPQRAIMGVSTRTRKIRRVVDSRSDDSDDSDAVENIEVEKDDKKFMFSKKPLGLTNRPKHLPSEDDMVIVIDSDSDEVENDAPNKQRSGTPRSGLKEVLEMQPHDIPANTAPDEQTSPTSRPGLQEVLEMQPQDIPVNEATNEQTTPRRLSSMEASPKALPRDIPAITTSSKVNSPTVTQRAKPVVLWSNRPRKAAPLPFNPTLSHMNNTIKKGNRERVGPIEHDTIYKPVPGGQHQIVQIASRPSIGPPLQEETGPGATPVSEALVETSPVTTSPQYPANPSNDPPRPSHIFPFVCPHWAQTNPPSCPKRSTCYFMHDLDSGYQEASQELYRQAEAESKTRGRYCQKFGFFQPPKVCLSFKNGVDCPPGRDLCQFAHWFPKPTEPTKLSKTCFFWLQPQSCRNPNCKFLHYTHPDIPVADPPASWRAKNSKKHQDNLELIALLKRSSGKNDKAPQINNTGIANTEVNSNSQSNLWSPPGARNDSFTFRTPSLNSTGAIPISQHNQRPLQLSIPNVSPISESTLRTPSLSSIPSLVSTGASPTTQQFDTAEISPIHQNSAITKVRIFVTLPNRISARGILRVPESFASDLTYSLNLESCVMASVAESWKGIMEPEFSSEGILFNEEMQFSLFAQHLEPHQVGVVVSTLSMDFLIIPTKSNAWSFLPPLTPLPKTQNLGFYAYSKGILPPVNIIHSNEEEITSLSIADQIDRLVIADRLPRPMEEEPKKVNRFFYWLGRGLPERVYIVPWDGWGAEKDLVTHYFREAGAEVLDLSFDQLNRPNDSYGVILFHQTFLLSLMKDIPNFVSILGSKYNIFRIGTDVESNQFECTHLFASGKAVFIIPDLFEYQPQKCTLILDDLIQNAKSKKPHERASKLVGRENLGELQEGETGPITKVDMNLQLLMDLVRNPENANFSVYKEQLRNYLELEELSTNNLSQPLMPKIPSFHKPPEHDVDIKLFAHWFATQPLLPPVHGFLPQTDCRWGIVIYPEKMLSQVKLWKEQYKHLGFHMPDDYLEKVCTKKKA